MSEQHGTSALVVSERSPKRSSRGLSKSPSFALSDLDAYMRAFRVSDRKKSGTIAAGDILHVANRLGYQISTDQLSDILSSNDLSESSPVTFELFLDLLPRNKRQISDDEHRAAELREKYHKYDRDDKGFISLGDAQFAMQSELGVSLPNSLSLLNQFIKLRYDQFVEFFTQVQGKKLEIYTQFGKFDADMDGMVSIKEAHKVLHRELGYSETKSSAMVKQFDLDKDGFLSYTEFGDFYMAFEQRKSKIRKTFMEFDEDGVGYLTNETAEQILRDVMSYTEEKSKKVVEMCDKNKDGNIDYEEFVGFYALIEQEHDQVIEQLRCKGNEDGAGQLSDEKLTKNPC